jgi:HK97 family phage portal protein
MHPDRVRVEVIKPSGRLRYIYDDPIQGKTRVLLGAPDAEVLHLRNYSDDGTVGQSTVAMGVDVFGTALARQDYAARFFQNDARPPAVFTNAAFKNKAAEQEFVESWQRGHTAQNRGRVGMLPPGMDFKVLGVSPVDSELLDGMKLSRVEITGIFGVPPHLIGEVDKASTYASVEQFNIQYVVYCLLPRLVLWEQAIQRDLILNDRYYPKFSVATLLRGDTASRYAAYAQAITLGWLCPDEVRAMEDLNAIPGGAGQTYWRQAALTPLSNTSGGTPPATTAPQDSGHDGSGAEPDNSALDRLRLLAISAADRCTRKEIAELRKLAARGASSYEIEEFYGEHVAFVRQVLRLNDEQVVSLRQEFWTRAGEFASAMNYGHANDYIDALAVKSANRVAELAMEGVRK